MLFAPRIIGYVNGRPVREIRGASDPAPEPTPEPTKTFTQDQVNALLADQKRKASEKFADYGDLKSKAEQLDKIQEENKSELQKALDRAESAEKATAAATTQAARATVAATKGVPVDLLSGTTQAELEASADALLAFKGTGTTTAPPTPTPVKGLTPGANKVGSEKSVAAGAAMFAERKKPTTTP